MFSGVYAVLNKKWKEKHHGSVCEILADVERECDVEISYEKGAYHFRGTSLTALSNVLKRLRLGLGGSRNVLLETNANNAQRRAHQDGELLDGKCISPYSAEVHNNSQSCTGQKDGRLDCALDTLAGSQNTVGDVSQISKDQAVEQRAQCETETHVEEVDNLLLATTADRVVNDHQSANSLHSASDALLTAECDLTHLIKAEAREEKCSTDDGRPLDQRQDDNTLPTSDPSSSLPYVTDSRLQARDNYEEQHKNAGTRHSTVDVKNKPGKTTQMSEDEQSGSKAVHSSSSLNHSFEASNDPDVLSGSPSVPGSVPVRSIVDSNGIQQTAGAPSDLEHRATEAFCLSTSSVGASADQHNLQRGSEMSDADKSVTVAASNKLIRNHGKEQLGLQANIKVLLYARDSNCRAYGPQ